jgi:nicotinate-nucleotide adenylyltransferase
MPRPRLRPPPFVTPSRLAAELGHRLPPPGARIGLLGGSFNPAHAGHLHISRQALTRLRLDEVWWLVSPQNPLKPVVGMGRLADRMESACGQARDPRIRVTALERLVGSTLTADTLQALTRWLPHVRFVWLMGADNLAQMHRWAAWQEIFHLADVAVLDRPAYSLQSMAGKAARRFARARVPEGEAGTLALRSPPAWTFLHIPRSSLSATALRARAPLAATGSESGPDGGPQGGPDGRADRPER